MHRNRRASTSSVETVDDSDIRWRQEASILKSVPKLSNNNDWPIFELKDAVVLNKDGHTMENALSVGSRGPFIVRGTVIIDDDAQKTRLLARVRRSTEIEIRQSISYSIGEAEGGQPIVWVSGKAGWYEIMPSASYLPIYNIMCEAATLYYSVMDIYKTAPPKKSKKRKGGLVAELSPVFHKYAAMIGDGSTLDEVIARCSEHAPFLISQFDQENKAEMDWSTTLFYKWMTTKHSDVVEKIRQQILNPPPPLRSPSVEPAPSPITHTLPSRTRAGSSVSSVAPTKHSSPALEARSSVPRQRSTKSQSMVRNDIPAQETPIAQPAPIATEYRASTSTPTTRFSEARTPADDQTPFETVLQSIESVYEELSKTRHGMTYSNTLNKIYLVFKWPTYRVAPGSHKVPVEEVLHYNAAELLKVLDKDKYGNFQFYSWLQELSQKEFNPVALKPSDFPYRIIPRGVRPKVVQKPPAPSGIQMVASVPRDSDDSGSINSDASPRAGKLPRGRPSGKKSSLRLVSKSRKRIHAELESDSEYDAVEPKRSHYFDDGDAMDVDGADASSPEETSEEPIKIVLRAEKVPSVAARGPNEVWICEEEECGYVVRGGDAQDCQDRVKKHFEEHERQANLVELAVTESRGHMPVNHLLEKLRSMGEKAQGADQFGLQDMHVPLPQRIKRKLIV